MKPQTQLELLESQGDSFRLELYKAYALYLQVLREIISSSTQKSILKLITITKQDLNDLPTESKQKNFQNKIFNILSETTSLLTIEHLIEAAKKAEEEQDLFVEKAKELIESNMKTHKISLLHSEDNHQSITLGMKLPLENDIDTDHWDFIDKEPFARNIEHYYSQSSDIESSDIESLESGINDQTNNVYNKDRLDTEDQDKDILGSIFELAQKTLTSNPFSKNTINDKHNDLETSQYESQLILPKTPYQLYNWLNSLENSLHIKLKKLSHFINLELIKCGLINSFVPVNVLDSIVSGHLNTLDSPPNIVRLRLPLNEGAMNNLVEVSCIFITPSELEFENFKLKQCRERLNKYKKVLMNLVKKQSYWEARKLEDHLKHEWWHKE